MENLHLIVGLGNPGPEYASTRHNAGFAVVEQLASRCHGSWALEKRFEARIARVEHGAKRLLLCQPQTFMNSSGEAVAALIGFYRVALERTLIIVDDADLPLGQLRLRPSGSPGGHHGLESIERCISNRNYARLRVGIGRHEGDREIANYVLGRFGSTERPLVDKVLAAAADQVFCWLDAGTEVAMNRFNGAVEGSVKERQEK